MKKLLFLIFITLLCLGMRMYGMNVQAFLINSTFNIPSKEPYLETYISVIGNSVKFVKTKNGTWQGSVGIGMSIKQKGEIKQAKRYVLNSPEITDTTKGFPNFIDQQRYSLPNGNYELEVTIADNNNLSDKPFTSTVPLIINFPDDRITISTIELLESYTKSSNTSVLTKNGYDLVPYVSNFFPANINKLKFYGEIYNSKKITGENEKIVISYYVESYESLSKLNDYSSFVKQTGNDVNILLSELDIEKLPSGNYNLVVEIRDKENKIQAQEKYFFQRKNKPSELSFNDLSSTDISQTFVRVYTNIDSLSDYIRCIRPISSTAEVQFSETQLKARNLQLMQQYFYNFWKSRNPVDPELTWLNYYKEVMKVNKEFGTYSLKGYDTDRGRVFLQYGPPDIRNKVDTDPGAYPYEIWEYFTLTDKALVLTNPNNRQSRKKFIFYNPDLVTNKYRLIHSDARGEVYDTRWELLIYKRDTANPDFDEDRAPSRIGGNANDNFQNPR